MSADHTFDWSWRGVAIPVRYDLFGANDRARVLLPALSTVSTRDEMAALARLLSRGRGVLVTDWPGFGDNPRPALDYEPDLYRAFLEALLAHLGDPAGRARWSRPGTPPPTPLTWRRVAQRPSRSLC